MELIAKRLAAILAALLVALGVGLVIGDLAFSHGTSSPSKSSGGMQLENVQTVEGPPTSLTAPYIKTGHIVRVHADCPSYKWRVLGGGYSVDDERVKVTESAPGAAAWEVQGGVPPEVTEGEIKAWAICAH